jgi:thiamine transporter ThiT
MPLIFLIAVLVSILQFTAVNFAGIGPYTFNLQIIALVFFSLRKGLTAGLALGIFFGLFNGLLGVAPVAETLIVYLAIGLITGYVSRWFYRESLAAFLFLVLCSLAAVYFVNIPASFFRIFLPAAVYNLAMAAFLFFFLRELRI